MCLKYFGLDENVLDLNQKANLQYAQKYFGRDPNVFCRKTEHAISQYRFQTPNVL